MSSRTKFLALGLAAVLAAAALVGWAMAQGSGEQATTATTPQTFLGRVAANLGVSEAKLLEAITQARLQTIDEAIAQGWITQEQADRMKEQISASQALLRLIDEALQQGKITQEQAALMKQRIPGHEGLGWGAWGFRGGHRGGRRW